MTIGATSDNKFSLPWWEASERRLLELGIKETGIEAVVLGQAAW